jgi:hypothetical protein
VKSVVKLKRQSTIVKDLHATTDRDKMRFVRNLVLRNQLHIFYIYIYMNVCPSCKKSGKVTAAHKPLIKPTSRILFLFNQNQYAQIHPDMPNHKILTELGLLE